MPTYDYECPDCQHHFERFHSMTADPIKECPSCGEDKVRRLIGAGAGLIFKGSGFYITDYRSKSYKDGKKQAEGGSSDKGSASKDSPKGDSGAKPSSPAPSSSSSPSKSQPSP